MSDLTAFNAARTFDTLARQANPAVKVLVCSWGPPAALKSNNNTRQGNLKQVDGRFLYDEYAQYWIDSLDAFGFRPDFISMQNEPDYVNAGWTTCLWRPTETAELPGYAEALDVLASRLAERPGSPRIIGPEAANLGTQTLDGQSVNVFRAFATPLKGKDYVYAYAYHVYHIGQASAIEGSIPAMNMVRDEFGDKPNFMTEFSQRSIGWLDTARLIQNDLIHADASAYIHWNMVWDRGSPDAMIGVDNSGGYQVNGNYYALKHFAKAIDINYRRVALGGSDNTAKFSAFVSPDGRKLVVVALNASANERSFNWNLGALALDGASAVRSVEGNFYQDLGAVSVGDALTLPAQSLTTYVLELSEPLVAPLPSWEGTFVDYDGWVNAAGFGWLYAASKPWIWSEALGWSYAEEPAADAPGMWLYEYRE